MTDLDPIVTELIRHGLIAVADEMARTLCRTAYNTVVYEIRDYGVGVHDAAGDVVADVPGIAAFTRANDVGIKHAVEFVGQDAMRPGDVFLLNYPYWSSAHTLDALMFAPIHHGGRLVGYSSCRVHLLDLKQKDPGYVLDSTDMAQEGIFFPVSRLYSEGVPNEDIWNIVRFNSRMPEATIGDMQAQVATCITGVRRTQELAARYGVDTVLEAMGQIHEHGAQLALAGLRTLPNGSWTAHDFVDNDGVDRDRPIRLQVTVTVTDDEMIVDWTGSERDVRGPINIPRGLTESISCLIFKSLTTPDSPVTAGNFRPLRVITDPGSVMHAVPPQPTFTMWPGLLAGEVILRALAQGMPDHVPACSGGDISSLMTLGTHSQTGLPWVQAGNEAVGFGGNAAADGEDGIMHLSEPGCRNTPVEVIESKAPLFIEAYGYREDSGGPGMNRGGVGVSRRYRFLAPSTAISLLYKSDTAPWAIGDGHEGTHNHLILNPGSANLRFANSTRDVAAGDIIVNNTGGGGGYGNPLERSPQRVADDVRNGFVSLDAARERYGVVIDPATSSVDEQATASLRGGAR
ncbi:hydantoinase B/oxoprolinase family protein [Streptomyces sp. NPDC127074]|uniref:hydantoinase B/oxoprolinase family protein n=1 Tax=Streptomyces sp. NPDC127074 TaxID=3347130 RepID=UPI00365237E0